MGAIIVVLIHKKELSTKFWILNDIPTRRNIQLITLKTNENHGTDDT